MLSQILNILRERQCPLCAETIARELGKDMQTVTAMLKELVLMGTVQVDSRDGACEACRLNALCGLPAGRGPFYSLPGSDWIQLDPSATRITP